MEKARQDKNAHGHGVCHETPRKGTAVLADVVKKGGQAISWLGKDERICLDDGKGEHSLVPSPHPWSEDVLCALGSQVLLCWLS